MEKPTKVEVGQRWNNPLCDRKYNPQIIERLAPYDNYDGTFSPGCILGLADGSSRSWPLDQLLDRYDFTGWAPGYGPQPPTPSARLGRVAGTNYCKHGTALFNDEVAAEMCASCHRDAAPVVAPAIVQYRGVPPQEWSTEGVARVGNLSALAVIQARKPPEPWRPSVDDWDLLPDAGR